MDVEKQEHKDIKCLAQGCHTDHFQKCPWRDVSTRYNASDSEARPLSLNLHESAGFGPNSSLEAIVSPSSLPI